MRTKLFDVGHKYQLYVHGPNHTPEFSEVKKVCLSIRSELPFDSRTNTVGVFLDKSTLEKVIEDLQARLKEME